MPEPIHPPGCRGSWNWPTDEPLKAGPAPSRPAPLPLHAHFALASRHITGHHRFNAIAAGRVRAARGAVLLRVPACGAGDRPRGLGALGEGAHGLWVLGCRQLPADVQRAVGATTSVPPSRPRYLPLSSQIVVGVATTFGVLAHGQGSNGEKRSEQSSRGRACRSDDAHKRSAAMLHKRSPAGARLRPFPAPLAATPACHLCLQPCWRCTPRYAACWGLAWRAGTPPLPSSWTHGGWLSGRTSCCGSGHTHGPHVLASAPPYRRAVPLDRATRPPCSPLAAARRARSPLPAATRAPARRTTPAPPPCSPTTPPARGGRGRGAPMGAHATAPAAWVQPGVPAPAAHVLHMTPSCTTAPHPTPTPTATLRTLRLQLRGVPQRGVHPRTAHAEQNDDVVYGACRQQSLCESASCREVAEGGAAARAAGRAGGGCRCAAKTNPCRFLVLPTQGLAALVFLALPAFYSLLVLVRQEAGNTAAGGWGSGGTGACMLRGAARPGPAGLLASLSSPPLCHHPRRLPLIPPLVCSRQAHAGVVQRRPADRAGGGRGEAQRDSPHAGRLGGLPAGLRRRRVRHHRREGGWEEVGVGVGKGWL